MKMTRRILSLVLAMAMVVTCGITGLVLPASAESTETVEYLNGLGAFNEGADLSSTFAKELAAAGAIVADPTGAANTVLQVPATAPAEGEAYKMNGYWKWKNMYNPETGAFDLKMTAGKAYKMTMDVYGDSIGVYFQGDYNVLSQNAETAVGGKAGWFGIGGAEEWKTYTFVFYANDDIQETYHSDWWSWGGSFNKGSNEHGGSAGFTYIDNLTVTEMQATEIAIDSADLVLEPGDVSEALTVTASPERSAYADVVWETNAEGVATVENGVVTAVGVGTATITATSGTLTDSITVTVQADKTQEWMDLSQMIYTGGDNTGNTVTVGTDEDGTQYVSVASGAHVKTPQGVWSKASKGEWLGYTFLVRVTDGANNPGAVRGAIQIQGGVTSGYTQPEFYARTTNMSGDWTRVTFYAKVLSTTATPWIEFITLSDGTTAATCSYDVADISIFRPEDGDVNLFGAGGDFEDGYVPVTIGNNTQAGGLINGTGVEVAEDPQDPNNKVLYIPLNADGDSTTTQTNSYWFVADQTVYDADDVRYQTQFGITSSTNQYPADALDRSKVFMYKIQFRVLSGSTVAFNSYGNGAFKGTTGTSAKAGEWRTVTTYLYTTSSYKPASALFIRFYGDAYIDDLEMYEVTDATGFEVKGDTEMTIGESQTLELVSVPKHAYPGTLTTTLSEDATGLTLSGTTVTAAAVAGTTVTGGTVTVTSDLTDADGNPITGSIAIKVSYPVEHFVNGSMDTGALDGITFTGAGTYAVDGAWAAGVEGIGIDGSNGMALYNTGAKYFKGQSFKLRPNSTYVFSAMAKSEGTGAKLELNLVTGNNSSGNKTVTIRGNGTRTINTTWTRYYMVVFTGETTTTMDTNWNLYFNSRALGTVDGAATAPILIDDISFRLLEDDEDRFAGVGIDFEKGGDENWDTYGSLAVGEGRNGGNAWAFTNTTTAASTNMTNLAFPLDSYGIYKISFWTRADEAYIAAGGDTRLYWGSPNAGAMYNLSSTAYFQDGSTEWTYNEFVFVTDGQDRFPANVFYFDRKKGTSAEGTLYMDDVKFERIAADNFLSASQTNTEQMFSIDGGATWSKYLTYVEPGTVVQVRNWQYSGYVMTPGSMKYTTPDGAEVKILNKDITNGYTAENFGEGDGRIFQFVMPETSARVTATFTSGSSTSYQLGTVGTSLRQTGTAGEYDGIRFLTRLNLLADSFKVDAEGNATLTVKHEGTEYEVVEIGSWLKRYEEAEGVEVELTADNAKWISVAYKKGDAENGDMKLLDYTGQYIDFTSVMLTTYTDRTYTARGYIVLEDADGNQITVTSGTQLSNSIDSASALL